MTLALKFFYTSNYSFIGLPVSGFQASVACHWVMCWVPSVHSITSEMFDLVANRIFSCVDDSTRYLQLFVRYLHDRPTVAASVNRD